MGDYTVVHRDTGADGWDVYWSDGRIKPVKENHGPFKTREEAQKFADILKEANEG